MRIAIAGDHAGLVLKNEMAEFARKLGHDVQDLGAYQYCSTDDYPDFAESVGNALQRGEADRGILICGSGVGVSVAANKMKGVRAALCHDTYSAHQGVEHDDMNVLVVGARIIGSEVAKEIVRSFLGARFTDEERHRRRLGKLLAVESRYSR